jgi:hypothetical protein
MNLSPVTSAVKPKLTAEQQSRVLEDMLRFYEEMKENYGPVFYECREFVEFERSLKLLAALFAWDELKEVKAELATTKQKLARLEIMHELCTCKPTEEEIEFVRKEMDDAQ